MEKLLRKARKLNIRSHLMGDMVLFSLAFLCLPFLFSALDRAQAWKASMGIILLFCFLMDDFYRRIYLPVTVIEKAIHGMVQGKAELSAADVKPEDELYPLYRDLHSLIGTLEDLISKESNATLMKKQAELDALQSQINPHFLYNTLESIRGQAIVYGLKDVEAMTQALSNLFRYSISSHSNLVPLSKELKNIDNYLMIQQYRFNNKFIHLSQVDEDTLDFCVPKLLIQPIVENSVHHGLETKVGKGTLTIRAYRTQKRLIIQVRDDGLGISREKLNAINDVLLHGKDAGSLKKAGMSIGLANVNERIRLNFGKEYGLRVYSTQGMGTNVEFTLPLVKDPSVT